MCNKSQFKNCSTSDFNGIWQQIKNKLENTSVEKVHELARTKNLQVIEIKKVQFGFDSSNPAILLTTKTGSAIYPLVSADDMSLYKSNKESTDLLMNFWRELDWFTPPYITHGALWDALNYMGIKVGNTGFVPKLVNQERFDAALSDIYTIGLMSVVTEQVLTQARTIKKHVPIIRESIIAFYSGMQIAAIAALIPIIENILGELIDDHSLKIAEKINKSIDNAAANVKSLFFNGADWFPYNYAAEEKLIVLDERYRMLETLRCWLINSFYCDTENYNNYSGFNRHAFAHATSDLWQKPSNFFRAIGLIQALAFVEAFSNKASSVRISIPKSNEDTISLHREVLACIDTQLIKKMYLQQYQLENSLPYKETASDDGWLLRASILADVMNNKIIHKLSDADWQCYEFTDPVEGGEYITISARKDTKKIKIALVYSCGTDNETYRFLDRDCDYILYNGPHYRQSSYAYGIKAQVMPVNAWIAPA